jgi:hypothetical protein
MPKTKILLSRETPTGYKLEELLQLIITDVEIKSEDLSVKLNDRPGLGCNKTDVMCEVLQNNHAIVKFLRAALSAQLSSLTALNTLGPDKGPTAPRV